MTTSKTCAVPTCPTPRYGSKGYCRKHQGRLDRNGTLEKKKPGPAPQAPRQCMVEGCERAHKGYGYCHAHLQAERAAGRLTEAVGVCAFTGCGRGQHANGLCNEHDRQRRTRGELSAIREYVEQGDTCSIDGCDLPTLSKGLCGGHYARQRDGRPLDGPLLRYKPKGIPCSAEACDREAEVEGMCPTHRRRWLTGAQPGWDDAIPYKAPNGTGHIDADGYRYISVDGVQKREHRYLAEQLLGRPLLETENVHHVNGVRHENRTDGPFVLDERGRMRSGNLEVWSHAQPAGQEIGPKLEWARSILALYGTQDEQASYVEHSPLTLVG